MGVRLREGILDVGSWTGGEITHAKDAKPRQECGVGPAREHGAGCEGSNA